MITKEMIRKGVLQSVIQFMPGPNGHVTICRIGDCWFYFGGQEAETMSPAEYLTSISFDDLVNEVFDAIDSIYRLDECEYEYCYHFIKENTK